MAQGWLAPVALLFVAGSILVWVPPRWWAHRWRLFLDDSYREKLALLESPRPFQDSWRTHLSAMTQALFLSFLCLILLLFIAWPVIRAITLR